MNAHSTPFIPNMTSNQPGDIILDCDGVILDWLGGFRSFYERTTGRKPDPAGPADFNLTKWLGAKDDDEMRDHVVSFSEGEAFGELPAMEGAREAIAALHAQGRGLHVLTACSSDPKVISRRHENIHDVFGNVFRSITCLDLHEDKSPYLSRYAAGSWVEDNFNNALQGAEAGHRTFLLRTSYNRKYEVPGENHPFTWVDGWKDILPFI